MARLKLNLYEAAIPDCFSSLELLSENMKAHYYLAQAELELGRLEDAYKSAMIAYELCSGGKTGVAVDRAWERSLGAVTALVLRCKKELWEKKERERLRLRNKLLEDMAAYLRVGREKEKADINVNGDATQEELERVDQQWAAKEMEMRRIWDVAADADGKGREVPDWAIDNITFAVMQDPVMVSFPILSYRLGHSILSMSCYFSNPATNNA
jgi:STIP1 homology and U-box containing protein 1